MRKPAPWVAEAHAHLCGDKRLGKIAQLHGPAAIHVERDLFETLVHSIAGQQLSGKAAQAIIRKLNESIGSVTPYNLKKQTPESLRAVGLSGAKAGTILELSQAFGNGLDEKSLRKMDDEEVIETLTKFKGIGPWTAEMFLMFALGRQDVMSPGDLGLRKGLQIVYKRKEMPSIKEAGPLFDCWRPYRTAASWYLWRATEGVNPDW
ncbi:MAG: DNA-3-methyladenine glycosylase [Armatimonadota bacterium]|nr:DNA-3-methyladenine glycosylase [Armatimonadota bacterium]